ncbi:hypothetical protein MNL13_06290 [Bartonella krasnovii]|uniref:Uncharacterized protein n=1 Tax=Bartonella krasnovii TaxID=2267275 RepID=A0ABY3VTW9_9HYPH|nr:hypothetical protein [Bartonella krasnovii]UNF28817.1 hypothetical protein MNL13_06290 [Bartonella krasnovii]
MPEGCVLEGRVLEACVLEGRVLEGRGAGGVCVGGGAVLEGNISYSKMFVEFTRGIFDVFYLMKCILGLFYQ